MGTRQPFVAGAFYPEKADLLRGRLAQLFQSITTTPNPDLAALIVPHAGYIYSGKVAATAYSRIERTKNYRNIFLIGVSHHRLQDEVLISQFDRYLTPLGEVGIANEIVLSLLQIFPNRRENKCIEEEEHTLEVQIPFLQYLLPAGFKIVPILLGSASYDTLKRLSDALQAWFTSENMFVISTDFSHYPDSTTAKNTDSQTCQAILSNNYDTLSEILEKFPKDNKRNLLTRMCGAAAVKLLLLMTRDSLAYRFEKLDYATSGDLPFGDTNRVVGYWAIEATRTMNRNRSLDFSPEEKKMLLAIARETIVQRLHNKIYRIHSDKCISELNFGAFVTLYKEGHLRGCIGRFRSEQSLEQTIHELALRSAFEDYRFQPVTLEELPTLKIEISILSPLKKIDSIQEICLGEDGIYLCKGVKSGVYLPQVATEQNWTLEEYLSHCSHDKAQLGWDGWKISDIYTFQTQHFSE